MVLILSSMLFSLPELFNPQKAPLFLNCAWRCPWEIFPVEADGNANFQNAVVDPALIQTGSLCIVTIGIFVVMIIGFTVSRRLRLMTSKTRFAEACISFRAQIVQYQQFRRMRDVM